ncbi:MAG: NTP transferase domain-containing protein [candidate division Zixibacteria bacterium]|nr:NTP transferase domain-containing protein [candidate division Zixibacteria bacterium]
MGEKLKIVVPLAGAGTRLRPHTFSLPKSLIPVAGKTMLEHVLDPLIELDPDEVCIIVGHLGDQIVEFVNRHYDFNATFVEQKELLGLGYAIHLALHEIDRSPLLVVLGDTIARTDFPQFIKGGHNVIGLQQVKDPRRFGVAVVDDNRIVALEEKPQHPKSNLALIGLYYFEDSKSLHDQLNKVIELDKRTDDEIQLTDALELMIRAGETFVPYEVDDWYDCGKVETLLHTNRRLLDDLAINHDYPGSVIIPPVYIDPTAQIENSVIGPYVSISPHARIFQSIIKNSIIFTNATVEQAVLEASLIGENALVRSKFRSLNIGESSGSGDL